MTAAARPRKSPARRAGRPAGEARDQRERLLDAAIACYSRVGIGATSLRSIAREANVNPALLHFYFGDKAQLEEAVVQERLLAAFETVRAPLLQADGDVAALVAAFVRGMGDAVARYPWLPALWVREVLCEGGALRGLLLGIAGLKDEFAFFGSGHGCFSAWSGRRRLRRAIGGIRRPRRR